MGSAIDKPGKGEINQMATIDFALSGLTLFMSNSDENANFHSWL
jgi:hypothetical protein